MKKTIALLPGDGIGTEIMEEAKKALRAVEKKFGHEFVLEEYLIGHSAHEKYGEYFPKEVAEACRNADAILLGATGVSDKAGRELILTIRKEFGFFSNIRPMVGKSKFNDKEFDFAIVRELSSGIYFGKREEAEYKGLSNNAQASDMCTYSVKEIERIARVGFDLARKRRKHVTSVDKANVMASSRLWRKVVEDVAKEYEDVEFQNMLVDNTAMQIIRDPSQFDVMLTSNLIGDILSDEAAGLVGSLGLMPSASLGQAGLSLYEPIHGSAPDIAGKGIANPIAMILSVAMMFDISFDMKDEARALRDAVSSTIEQGFATRDFGKDGSTFLNTQEMGDKIVSLI